MIRPESVMSTTSSVSTIRSHKKRRAPQPPAAPARVEKPAEKVDIQVSDPKLAVPDDVKGDRVKKEKKEKKKKKSKDKDKEKVKEDVDASNNSEQIVVVVDTPEHNDDVEKKKSVETFVSNDDNYEEAEETVIILSSENEDGDNANEPTGDVQIEVEKSEDVYLPERVERSIDVHVEDKSEKLQQQSSVPIPEEEITVFQSDSTPEPQPETNKVDEVKEMKKEKHKKKSKDRDTSAETKEKKKKKKSKEHQTKEVSSLAKQKIEPVEPVELPSFRGAKAAEVHKINDDVPEARVEHDTKADNDDLESVESEGLVHSDDELVDLFRMSAPSQGIRGQSVRSDSKNVEHTGQEAARDRDTKELTDVVESVQDDAEDNKDKPKKLSGKEIQERKVEEIRHSVVAAASLHVDDESEMKSETLRHELKNLQTGETSSEPAYKREKRAVELDIESEDEMLPSLASSRASSVINLADAEDDELNREFAVREMKKGAETRIKKVDYGDEFTDNNPATNNDYTKVQAAVIVDEPEQSRVGKTSQNNAEVSGNIDIIESISKHDEGELKPGAGIVTGGAVVRDESDSSVLDSSVKSPSPDSGIHDFTDSCSSPVSVRNVSPYHVYKQDDIHVYNNKQDDIHVYDDDDDDSKDEVDDQVELPKTHNLPRVLFSMSSYSDRKLSGVEQSSSSVLSGEESAAVKSRNQPPPGHAPATGSERNKTARIYATTTSLVSASSKPNPISSKVDLPEYRRERSDHSTGYAPVSVRSKIIEEFQARKGVIILGRSHSSSLDRSSSGDEKMMQNVHSLDRRGKYLDERNYFKRMTPESHYDSPRNLMMNNNTAGPPSISLGTWKDKSRVRAAVTDQYDEEYQGVGNISSNSSHSNKLSPPRVPVSHSKTYDHSKERRDTYDPNRHDSRDPNSAQPKQIEIRYRNGGKTSGETIENPRKAVVKGSRTSRGDFNGEDRINYSKPEVPIRPKLHSRNNFTNSNGIEPVIIPKVGFCCGKYFYWPSMKYF